MPGVPKGKIVSKKPQGTETSEGEIVDTNGQRWTKVPLLLGGSDVGMIAWKAKSPPRSPPNESASAGQEDMASKLERARRTLKEAEELRERERLNLQRVRGRVAAEDAANAASERRRHVSSLGHLQISGQFPHLSKTYEGVRRLSHERISFAPPQKQPARPRVPSAHTPEGSPPRSRSSSEH
jgi:hypothetical protein